MCDNETQDEDADRDNGSSRPTSHSKGRDDAIKGGIMAFYVVLHELGGWVGIGASPSRIVQREGVST